MTPTADEIRAALEKILNSVTFAQSERHKAFLRFVVEESLAGRGERIKGYTIGVEVYGKSTDFDAQSDPYVRVEAGRLRKRLDEYYRAEGADDPLRIVLERGHYAPVFRYLASEQPSESTASPESQSNLRQLAGWGIAASLLAIVGTLIAVNLFSERSDPQTAAIEAPLSLRIRNFDVGDNANLDSFVEGLIEEIHYWLDTFGSTWSPIEVFTDEDLMDLEITDGHDYILDARVEAVSGSIHVMPRLVDGISAERIWIESYEYPFTAEDTARIQDMIARQIANAIREPFGPIADAEVETVLDRDVYALNAYECKLLFLRAVDTLARTVRDDAKRCLERHDASDELDATGLGALAFLYHLDYDDGLDFRTGQAPSNAAAYETALRALEQNSRDILAQMSMAFVNLERGRFAEAEESIDTLISLSPPTSTSGILALLNIKLGDDPRTSTFINAEMNQTTRPTSSLFFGVTIFHLQAGDYAKALRFAEQINAPEFVMTQVLLAATSAHAGEMEQAMRHCEQILDWHTEFAGIGRELIERWALPEEVNRQLIDGLAIAGLELL